MKGSRFLASGVVVALVGLVLLYHQSLDIQYPRTLSFNKTWCTHDLKNASAADRDLGGVTVDLSYKLNVPLNWWVGLNTAPEYRELMHSLHGRNIWKDEGLLHNIERLGVQESRSLGSPLVDMILLKLINEVRPRIFLEVGVFYGLTSTKVAKFFRDTEGFNDSFVLSMDTWLLDLRFAWSGPRSSHNKDVKYSSYFDMPGMASGGGSNMYYSFLSNCINTNTTDKIIPLPTASQNGAMALLAHGVRPELMYIDASHSNPDVFIDIENFYTILKPGGAMAFDDLRIVPAVSAAVESLIARYGLELVVHGNQGYVFKSAEEDVTKVALA